MEILHLDAQLTIENTFNNRLCDECGSKNGNKNTAVCNRFRLGFLDCFSVFDCLQLVDHG